MRCGSQLDRGQRTHLWNVNRMFRMPWIRLLNAMSRAEQSREQSPLVNLFDMQTTTKIAIMSHLHIKATVACENTYLNTYVNTYTCIHTYYTYIVQYNSKNRLMIWQNVCKMQFAKLAQHNELYNVR